MNDLDISVTTVIATILWSIGAALALLELVSPLDTGSIGMVIAAGGATLNVRGYFVKLEHREHNAFELGRDIERTRMHSVP